MSLDKKLREILDAYTEGRINAEKAVQQAKLAIKDLVLKGCEEKVNTSFSFGEERLRNAALITHNALLKRVKANLE